jgi:hypothetical protein
MAMTIRANAATRHHDMPRRYEPCRWTGRTGRAAPVLDHGDAAGSSDAIGPRPGSPGCSVRGTVGSAAFGGTPSCGTGPGPRGSMRVGSARASERARERVERRSRLLRLRFFGDSAVERVAVRAAADPSDSSWLDSDGSIRAPGV